MVEAGERPEAGELVVSVAAPAPGVVVLGVAGEIDMMTAPELTARVHAQFEAGPVKVLVVDLGAVTFLGSAGLAVLAEAHHVATEVGAVVRVVASTRTVLRPLQVTGLDQLLTVVADVDAAVVDAG